MRVVYERITIEVDDAEDQADEAPAAEDRVERRRRLDRERKVRWRADNREAYNDSQRERMRRRRALARARARQE